MTEITQKTASNSPADNSPAEVFTTFLKLGCSSFGGPIAHIGYFRKELVERRKWITEGQFTQLLAICQFLPGPTSSQLGFSLGLARAGWPGALAAFIAFTLPSALLLVGFAFLSHLLIGSFVQSAVHGLKIVAFAVVADAVLGMAKKLCPDIHRASLALLAACLLIFLANDYWIQLLVVIGGGIGGILMVKSASAEPLLHLPFGYSKKIAGMLLLVFFALLIGLPLLAFDNTGLAPLADAFYRAGALVFGGGHVVLPLLEDSVVSSGWVAKETFLAGYGASQAIPGPMFAFSAYLGAAIPTGENAWLGATVALLFIFLPGFLLIAAVVPFWQSVADSIIANNAIAGINAAVVGLLGAALYDPIFTSAILSLMDMAIGVVALAMLSVWRLSVLTVVAWCTVMSMLASLF